MRTLEILYILELELLNAKHFKKMKPPNLGTVNTKLKTKIWEGAVQGSKYIHKEEETSP